MHSKDRRWPVAFWLMGFVLAMVPLVTISVYTFTATPLQQVYSILSEIDWSSVDTCQNLWLIGTVAIFLLSFAVSGLRARRREQTRLRAITGDESAMPLVDAHPDLSPESTTDAIAHLPFSLRWANGNTITATENGLRWLRPHRRGVSLAWGDARLLERWEHKSAAPGKKQDIFQYSYCLYTSSSKYIEWTDAPESQANGERLSWEQKERLQEELLALVTACTELPLRAIADRRSTAQTPRKKGLLSGIAFLDVAVALLLAGFPLVTGILALIVPLTRSFTLNLYVAIIDGGVGLLLLGISVKALLDGARSDTSLPPPPILNLPLAPPSVTHEAYVAIRFGSRLRDRLIALLLMLTGLASTIFLFVRAMQDFPDTDVKHIGPHTLALDMLVLCAFVGITIAGVGTFSGSTVLLADESGFHRGKGKKGKPDKRGEFIPWPDVAMLIMNMSQPNELESFTVLEAPPKSRMIGWRAVRGHRGREGGRAAHSTVGIGAPAALE